MTDVYFSLHPNAGMAYPCLRQLNDFGYSMFDSVIDHGYDEDEDDHQRLAGAVASARDFVNRFDSDDATVEIVRAEATRNINWTLRGFARHYMARFGAPIAEFLRLDLPRSGDRLMA